MELFSQLGAALVFGVILGAIVSGRLASVSAADDLKFQKNLNYSDQKLYVDAMARNYAQILFPRFPDMFVEVENDVYDFIKSMESMSDDQLVDILDEISQRNPSISDFDKIHLRDYVIFQLNLFSAELKELITAYKDCCVYSIFLNANMIFSDVRHRAKNYETSSLDKDGRYIEKYSREYKDDLFMHKCLTAMREFSAVEQYGLMICERLDAKGIDYDYHEIFREGQYPLLYKSESFEVYFVPHTVEQQRGIKFLDTDEYAVQGLFYDNKVYVTWQRTDESFKPLNGYDYQIRSLHLEYLTVPFDIYTEQRSVYTR